MELLQTIIQYLALWITGLMIFFVNPFNRITDPDCPHNPYHHYRYFYESFMKYYRKQDNTKVAAYMEYFYLIENTQPYILSSIVNMQHENYIHNWWDHAILESSKATILCAIIKWIIV